VAELLPPPSHAPAVYTAVLLIAVHLSVAVIDLVAWYTDGRIASVSSVLQQWAKESPLLPLVIGMVLGHLFWPSRHRL
jgi:hypothetical protein